MATEKRLIDANALSKEIERIYSEHYAQSSYQFIHDFFRAILRRIRREQTVYAVEVVRCKDCKHYAPCVKPYNKVGMCNSKMIGLIKADDFCSYGEREDNER